MAGGASQVITGMFPGLVLKINNYGWVTKELWGDQRGVTVFVRGTKGCSCRLTWKWMLGRLSLQLKLEGPIVILVGLW